MNNNIEDFNYNFSKYQTNVDKQKEVKKPIFKKRFKEYNPDQMYFSTFNPKECFKEGCYERFIVDTMKKIDINEFEKIEGLDLGGPDEYNPRAILAIIFYGESDGVFSSRKLENLCIYDTRYIYLSGGITPDHSKISRFLNKYEEQILKVFSQILYVADDMGYIDYKILVTDGSKFRAYAAKKFSGTLEMFRKRQNKLESKIKLAIEKQKQTDKEEETNYWKNKEERYKKEIDKIGNFLEEAKEIYNQRGKEIIQNITDNDCRIMKNKNSWQEGYNSQVTVCEKNGIIVGCNVTNDANDYAMFQEMIEKTKEQTKEEKKEKLKEAKYLNDNGYYNIDNLIFCDENNIDAYIPDGKDKTIFEDKKEDDENKKKLNSDDCIITIENDCVIVKCPNGEDLVQSERIIKKRDEYYEYRIKNKKTCEYCKNKKKCIDTVKKEKNFTFKKKIIDNYHLIENMKNKIRTNEGKMIYSRRMPTVEKIFGHMKNNLRLERFFVRGLRRTNTQWALLCTTYNLKRIFNLKIQEN